MQHLRRISQDLGHAISSLPSVSQLLSHEETAGSGPADPLAELQPSPDDDATQRSKMIAKKATQRWPDNPVLSDQPQLGFASTPPETPSAMLPIAHEGIADFNRPSLVQSSITDRSQQVSSEKGAGFAQNVMAVMTEAQAARVIIKACRRKQGRTFRRREQKETDRKLLKQRLQLERKLYTIGFPGMVFVVFTFVLLICWSSFRSSRDVKITRDRLKSLYSLDDLASLSSPRDMVEFLYDHSAKTKLLMPLSDEFLEKYGKQVQACACTSRGQLYPVASHVSVRVCVFMAHPQSFDGAAVGLEPLNQVLLRGIEDLSAPGSMSRSRAPYPLQPAIHATKSHDLSTVHSSTRRHARSTDLACRIPADDVRH